MPRLPAAPRPASRRLLFAGYAALPLGLVATIFVAVLRVGTPVPFPRANIPAERFVPERCTWACHNHGCQHSPRLPDWLSSDEGLFGQTVHGLHRLGRWAMPHSPRQGYGLVNLIIFCLLWPALMWGLYLKGLSLSLRLRQVARSAKSPTGIGRGAEAPRAGEGGR
jgi:hypothetical protein